LQHKLLFTMKITIILFFYVSIKLIQQTSYSVKNTVKILMQREISKKTITIPNWIAWGLVAWVGLDGEKNHPWRRGRRGWMNLLTMKSDPWASFRLFRNTHYELTSQATLGYIDLWAVSDMYMYAYTKGTHFFVFAESIS
jgi:hypothetical protein